MGVDLSDSADYEARANLLRAQMGATIDELRSNLTPSNLAAEAASHAGINDLSWAGAFEFASRRHPVPTAIVGFGIGLWLLSAVGKRASRDGFAGSLRDSSASLVDSASRVFRQRAEAKRREVVSVAQTRVETGAAMLSDAIEKKLEDVVDRVPGGIQVRPLIDSAVQFALAAAIEGLVQRRSR